MDIQEAIKELEKQFHTYESIVLYNKDFEPKNDNSNYEHRMDCLKISISSMKELEKYKKLGTLEELPEAIDKQIPEKPQEVYGIFGYIEYECRECGNCLSEMERKVQRNQKTHPGSNGEGKKENDL